MRNDDRPKCIYDYKHVKGVRAIALLKNGKEAGKIIANYSDNPSGTVCTAQVMLYGDEWYGKIKKHKVMIGNTEHEFNVPMIGKAGGYGYDKLSAAIAAALRVGGIDKLIKVEGGAGNQRQAFEAAGFTWIEIC